MPLPPEGATASPAFTLRRALPADAAEIARLSTELGYPASAQEIADRLISLRASATECVVVADAGEERLLGWIAVSKRILLEYGARAEIVGLIVERPARRLGVGRALIAAAEDWARADGTELISVHSNVVRPDSHPFYENLGYRREKTQHCYVKVLERGERTSA